MLHQTMTESTLAKPFAHENCLIWKEQRKTVVKCLQNIQNYLGNHFIGLDSVYFMVKNAK